MRIFDNIPRNKGEQQNIWEVPGGLLWVHNPTVLFEQPGLIWLAQRYWFNISPQLHARAHKRTTSNSRVGTAYSQEFARSVCSQRATLVFKIPDSPQWDFVARVTSDDPRCRLGSDRTPRARGSQKHMPNHSYIRRYPPLQKCVEKSRSAQGQRFLIKSQICLRKHD